VERLRPIRFTAALGLLQGMIGEPVQILVNLPGCFFDCGFHARLQRVETLSGGDGPVLIVLERAQGIALDPDELVSFVGHMSGLPAASWLEFHIGERLWLSIEPLAGACCA
jgi:hypothetical protein